MNEQSANDLAALQGEWKQLSVEIGGVGQSSDALSPHGGVTIFIGDRFIVRDADGVLLLEGTFSLDASADPKHVDWLDATGPDAGKPLPAIYRLDGDEFIFVAADAGSPRPSLFHACQGQVMRRFVRLGRT